MFLSMIPRFCIASCALFIEVSVFVDALLHTSHKTVIRPPQYLNRPVDLIHRVDSFYDTGLPQSFPNTSADLFHTSGGTEVLGLPTCYLKRPSEPGPIPTVLDWGLTVVIMGFTDQASMTRSACHHATLGSLVQRVLLVWNSETVEWKGEVECKKEPTADIKVLPQTHNTLLNRWAVWPGIDTQGVLLIDDDVLIKDSKSLMHMYTLWRDHPLQIVGLAGLCPYKTSQGFVYDFRDCQGRISITSGRGNMLHRNYMQLFMARQPTALLEHIYSERPACEDIALHFLVSNQTGLPPLEDRDIWEEQTIKRVEMDNGKEKDWLSLRAACTEKFTQLYGRYPLVGALPLM